MADLTMCGRLHALQWRFALSAALCALVATFSFSVEAAVPSPSPQEALAASAYLRGKIAEAAVRPEKLTFYCDFLGSSTRARLADAGDEGIVASIVGQQVPVAWDALSPEVFYRLAKAAIDDNAGKDHAALSRWCSANGLLKEAEQEWARALELDPSFAPAAAPSPAPSSPSAQPGLPLQQGQPMPSVSPEQPLPEVPSPLKGTVKVPLFIDEPFGIARQDWPITCGIPFADGELPAAYIAQGAYRMLDASGRELPCQAEVAVLWGRYPAGPNGYARWVHVTFAVNVPAKGRAAVVFEAGTGVKNNTRQGIGVEPAGKGLMLTTGPLKFAVGTEGMNLFDGVWLDANGDGKFAEDERIVVQRSGNMLVEYDKGKGVASSDAGFRVELEESGPLRATVKVTSKYDGVFESVVRIYAYAGKPYLRVQDTLIHGPTGQGQIDLERVPYVRLTEHSLALPLALGDGARAVFGGGGAVDLGEAWLEQDVAHEFKPGGGFRFDVKTPVGVVYKGDKAPGWVDVSDGNRGVTASIRYFHQLFPKRLRAAKGALKLELWARNARLKPDGCNNYWQGMARTHDIFLVFHSGGFSSACEALALSHQNEVFAVSSPEKYCSSLAYGRNPIPAGREPRMDALVYRIVGKDGRSGFPEWRDRGDAYGYFNFGDSLLGPYWSCLEYDSPWGLIQNFYRLGDPDILREAAILCRGAYDILFHHQTTETSSVYPQCSHDKQEVHFSGGDSHGQHSGTDPGHVFISGLVNYWYLTGDRRAKDVIFWAFKGYYGDDKERITCGGTWRYCGGYLAEIFVRAYELTWDKRYIERIDWMAERVFRSTPTRHADGVWWDASGGKFNCQPWLGDSVAFGYTSYIDINPGSKYRKDIEDGIVKIADFVDKHAYARDKKAIHQGLIKDSKDATKYTPTGQYYGDFMCMMNSFTMCRAYMLTGNAKYLDAARQLFNDGLAGWDSNEAKSAGEAMLYANSTLFYIRGGKFNAPGAAQQR